MKHKIIFLGGVHGVGKTSLCNKMCEELSIEGYSASNLIKRVKNVKFPTNKHSEEINGNQDTLIVAVNKYIRCKTACLLDGHFCLLNEKGVVIQIPASTFSSLSPIAIIVLSDEPSSIHKRVQNRDGNVFEVDNIAAFQEREIMYSKIVSVSLGVPYLLANPFAEEEKIKDFLRNLI